MDQASPTVEGDRACALRSTWIAADQRKSCQRQKNEVVAQGETGALSGATPHGTAQAAVYATVILIFSQLKLGRVRTNIANHACPSSLSIIPLYHTLNLQIKQCFFVNFPNKPSVCRLLIIWQRMSAKIEQVGWEIRSYISSPSFKFNKIGNYVNYVNKCKLNIENGKRKKERRKTVKKREKNEKISFSICRKFALKFV
jgi:hypothetical protein